MSYRDECEKLYVENIELKEKLQKANDFIAQLEKQIYKYKILIDKINNALKNK